MTDEQVVEIYKLVKGFCKQWNLYDEDLVQDMVWEVYTKADKFDETKGKLSTFIYTICRNYYLCEVRRKKIETVSADAISCYTDHGDEKYFIDLCEDESETPLEKIINNEKGSISYIYNNICSPMLKMWLQGYKQEEIAKQYKLTKATINYHINREIDKLRETYTK